MKFIIVIAVVMASMASAHAKAVDLTSKDLENYLRQQIPVNIDRVLQQGDDYGDTAMEQDDEVAQVMADKILEELLAGPNPTATVMQYASNKAKAQFWGALAKLVASSIIHHNIQRG